MRESEKALRAQLLATEHWSLLSSRGSTQTEMLSRIGMFLTLVSAGLVSLGLVGQAMKFSDTFSVFAIVVLAVVSLVGILTQVRVTNIAMEDLMYVLAMNRLRSAYSELDPGVAPLLMASRFDDFAGVQQTYYFLSPKRGLSQVAGSSMVFIMAVNTALLGLLVAVIASLAGATLPVAAVVGAVVGLAYFLWFLQRGERNFRRVWTTYEPHSPTPAE